MIFICIILASSRIADSNFSIEANVCSHTSTSAQFTIQREMKLRSFLGWRFLCCHILPPSGIDWGAVGQKGNVFVTDLAERVEYGHLGSLLNK